MQILIVDDSKAMRMIVMRTLKQTGLTGYRTCEAGDGAEALQLITTQNPDLVLSDWNMPGMKGIDLLRQVRESGRTTRFGFVTSESGTAIHNEAIAAGASFVVTKPFTPQAFEAALKPMFS